MARIAIAGSLPGFFGCHRAVRCGVVPLHLTLVAAVMVSSACGRSGFNADADADANVDAPPSGSLIAQFRMDDDPADGADDSSPYGHHARCTMCPTPILARGSGAYQFDGMTTLLEVPYDQTLAPVPGVTAAAWIRVMAGFTATRCVISKPVGAAIANTWQVCLDSSLSVMACFGYANIPPATGCLSTAPGVLQSGAWHHVALRYDGDIASLFVDGTLRMEAQLPIGNDDHPILIGGDVDNGAPFAMFVGFIDDVQVWNVPLPADEIAALAAP